MIKQLLLLRGCTRAPGMCNLLPCGTWGVYSVLCYEGCEGHGTANGLPPPAPDHRLELNCRKKP